MSQPKPWLDCPRGGQLTPEFHIAQATIPASSTESSRDLPTLFLVRRANFLRTFQSMRKPSVQQQACAKWAHRTFRTLRALVLHFSKEREERAEADTPGSLE